MTWIRRFTRVLKSVMTWMMTVMVSRMMGYPVQVPMEMVTVSKMKRTIVSTQRTPGSRMPIVMELGMPVICALVVMMR